MGDGDDERDSQGSRDEQTVSRVEVISRLTAIFGHRAFEHLVISLWDEGKWVRIAAAGALGELMDRAGISVYDPFSE